MSKTPATDNKEIAKEIKILIGKIQNIAKEL